MHFSIAFTMNLPRDEITTLRNFQATKLPDDEITQNLSERGRILPPDFRETFNVGNRNALNMHYEVLFCNIAFAGSQLVMCVNIRHAILNHVFGSMNATRTQIGQSFRVRKKFVACTRDIHIALGVYTLFANTKRLRKNDQILP